MAIDKKEFNMELLLRNAECNKGNVLRVSYILQLKLTTYQILVEDITN